MGNDERYFCKLPIIIRSGYLCGSFHRHQQPHLLRVPGAPHIQHCHAWLYPPPLSFLPLPLSPFPSLRAAIVGETKAEALSETKRKSEMDLGVLWAKAFHDHDSCTRLFPEIMAYCFPGIRNVDCFSATSTSVSFVFSTTCRKRH
ncbi:hypothetical protein KP509_07G096500 [Ceratopteris richardii]|uniref:Uncharacterized protein n=1 Tax=Ceratopteris richardii TaxID=49495 RepID=A0A8T2UHP9_CERRI|nr:hypothetical protein KP509_07G096500 [Ceratopteris richardii]